MDAKQAIRETLAFQDLTEQQKSRRGILGRLYGPCASIVHATRNGRKYSDELWEKVFTQNEVVKEMEDSDICVSIGGDNYCYGTPGFIYLINGEVRQRKAKTILWGCSIETADIDERMKEDLQ